MKNTMAIKVRLDSEVWDSEIMNEVCQRNGYYNLGSKVHYKEMLEYVDNNPPTLEHIAVVAKDIWEHSDKGGFQLIFNVIANRAVMRIYDIQEVK